MSDAPAPEITIHVIAGPTASGKTAAATAMAEVIHGAVINCDSLQIYDALPILTAQPTAQDKRNVPHYLYAALAPNALCSAGVWRDMARTLIPQIHSEGRTPIICGGTGLYIKALMEGLAPIPPVPAIIRETLEKRYAQKGGADFYEEFKMKDPVMAARIHPAHKSRLMRAAEVLEATGKSLALWQALDRNAVPENWSFEIHKIIPERSLLHENCNARFLRMLENGALEEVEDFSRRIESGEIAENAPPTRALGFKELRAYLKGALSKEEAIAKSQAQTRQYAKRQITWLRNQL